MAIAELPIASIGEIRAPAIATAAAPAVRVYFAVLSLLSLGAFVFGVENRFISDGLIRAPPSVDWIPPLSAQEWFEAFAVHQRDPAFARQALSAGAVGYVLKDAADGELVLAVRLAASGQTYLNPQLGARLAAEPVDARPGDLTERELDIVRLIALGHTNPQIAEQLHVAERTVKTYRARAIEKLGFSSRAEITAYARRLGLVD